MKNFHHFMLKCCGGFGFFFLQNFRLKRRWLSLRQRRLRTQRTFT